MKQVVIGLLAMSILLVSGAIAQAQYDCNDVGEIPSTECAALVALYNATNGDAWGNRTGWLDTTTPCSWYGVTCSGGHVSGLSLSGNQLSGAIPAELGNLTGMGSLGLNDNSLSGALPQSLTNLSNLTLFHFGGTSLCEPGDATFQAWLTNITSLERTNVTCLPTAVFLTHLEAASLSNRWGVASWLLTRK